MKLGEVGLVVVVCQRRNLDNYGRLYPYKNNAKIKTPHKPQLVEPAVTTILMHHYIVITSER